MPLRNPPATLLLAPLGLAALGLAWSEAAYVFALPTGPGGLITGFAAGLLVLLTGVAGLPAVRHWQSPHQNPAPYDRTLATAAAALTAVLLAGAALPREPGLSLVLWIAGLIGIAAATGVTVGRVIAHRRNPLTLRPGLFLVPCGFMALPVAGIAHGYYAASVALYLCGIALTLLLYGLVFAHMVSGWKLADAAPIERAARAAAPIFAFFGYQGINGGFADPTAVVLAALVLPCLGEIVPSLSAARRAPADPRAWLCVVAVAAVALVLLILYEWIGGIALATVATLALAVASFAALYAFYFCLAAAARGSARAPYRQPPPAER